MKSLSEVEEAQKRFPNMRIWVEREVRFFANIGGVRHYLYNDWTADVVDNKMLEELKERDVK